MGASPSEGIADGQYYSNVAAIWNVGGAQPGGAL